MGRHIGSVGILPSLKGVITPTIYYVGPTLTLGLNGGVVGERDLGQLTTGSKYGTLGKAIGCWTIVGSSTNIHSPFISSSTFSLVLIAFKDKTILSSSALNSKGIISLESFLKPYETNMLSMLKDYVVLLLAFDVGNSIVMWRLGSIKIDSNIGIGNEYCTSTWVEIWDTYNFSTS